MNYSDEILWVRLTGSLAQFRKPTSMTTKKTYDIPPRTTIAGLLAAGLGYGSNQYYEIFDPSTTKLGVQVCSDVTTKSFAENYKTTTSSEFKSVRLPNGERASMQKPEKFVDMNYQQEATEYIRDPEYIVYIDTSDLELHNQLKEMFETRCWVHQPYFGTSECLAAQRDAGSISQYESVEATDVTVDTVVPDTQAESVWVEEDQLYVDQFVTNFEKDNGSRKIQGFTDYYYTRDSDTNVLAKSDNVYKVTRDGERENIIMY